MEIDAIVEAFIEKAREQNHLMSTCRTHDELQNQYKNALNRYRHDLEPYVFQYLTVTYGSVLEEFWKTHQFPLKSKNAWVIAERRPHVNWWFFLRNIAWAGPDMALYIFCSNENIEFLKRLLGDKQHTVHLIPWFKGFADRNHGVEEYNRALTTADLYKQIDAEYALFAQLDTYFIRKVPDSIFMGEYYGAPWNWVRDAPGGGGLSIRKCQTMISLCTEEKRPDDVPEDSWISDRIREKGFPYPDFDTRAHIFTESCPVDSFIGTHQFWTFIESYSVYDRETYKKILKTYLTIQLDDVAK